MTHTRVNNATSLPPTQRERPRPRAKTIRLLIVDDDAGVRGLLRTALEDEGYECATCTDGESALRACATWSPHLILLDYRLPRMDGASFVAAYRRTLGPHAPIVITSAEPDPHIPDTLYLGRPFDIEELLSLVQHLVPHA